MRDVFLSLGSNQGNRFFFIQQAIQNIELRIGSIEKISSYYETEPWGFSDETNFINQVIKIKSSLPADKILARALLIEKALGRIRIHNNGGYSSRPIDIDILFIDDAMINTDDLKVPHERMHKRNFVLRPLCEIAPNFIHPILKKSIQELAASCEDKLEAKKLECRDIVNSFC